ncbi:MAG TPA: hypothetical protein VGA84_08085 [Thermoanaerobaculia bacterium]
MHRRNRGRPRAVRGLLHQLAVAATALNPIIGYARAAEIAKESAKSGTPIPQLLRQKKLLSEEEIARIFTPEFLAGQGD